MNICSPILTAHVNTSSRMLAELKTIHVCLNRFVASDGRVEDVGILSGFLKAAGLYSGRESGGGRPVRFMAGRSMYIGFVTFAFVSAYFFADFYLVKNHSDIDGSWKDNRLSDMAFYVAAFWVATMVIFWIAGIPTMKFLNGWTDRFALDPLELDDVESVNGDEHGRPAPQTALCAPIRPTGHLVELLNGLEPKVCKKIGNKTAAYIVLVGLICSAMTVTEGLVTYARHLDSDAAVALMMANRFVWSFLISQMILPWYAVFALAMILMNRRIEQIHTVITTFFHMDTAKDYTDFDQIMNYRHRLSALADSLSRRFGRLAFWSVAVCAVSAVGITFRAIQMDVEEVGQMAFIFVSVVLFGLVIYVLAFASMIYNASVKNFEFLCDVKNRFPARNEYEAEGVLMFNKIKVELDSFIAHCERSPLGFRLHDLKVTPSMVKAIVYALFSIISIFIQMRLSSIRN